MKRFEDSCFDNLGARSKDMTLEEIEREIENVRKPDVVETIRKFLDSLSPRLQKLMKKYPADQIYRIKKGAPYRFTCEGCVVSLCSILDTVPVEFRVLVLRSPVGSAGISATVEPQWLEPVTIDQLRSELN